MPIRMANNQLLMRHLIYISVFNIDQMVSYSWEEVTNPKDKKKTWKIEEMKIWWIYQKPLLLNTGKTFYWIESIS